MRTYQVLSKSDPDRSEGEQDFYPPALVELFLRRYTITDDLVLDPFAGFGTTLVTAERLGRGSIGIEFLAERASFIESRIGPDSRLIHGDSRRIDELGLPRCDFSITSPPYMCRGDTEDPLQGYSVPGNGYDAYLAGLRDIYRRMRTVMKPDAVCVVNVSNIKRWDGLTTLAWDVACVLSDVMVLEGEVIICWDDSDETFGYDHEYCLVFRNRDG